MTILVLEDQLSTATILKRKLEERGHIIYVAFTVREAKKFWLKKKIDCIIIDLNLSFDGLKNEEIKKSKTGLLTGWIWVNEYVFKKDTKMKQNTIIFTNYYSELKKNVEEEELMGVFVVEKKALSHLEKYLLPAVDNIASKLKRWNNES